MNTKKTSWQRLLALLTFVLVLGMIPFSAFAESVPDPEKNQVRVIVSNDTYSKADGAPWEGDLVDEWVTINEDSTMMSAVVAALTAKGYEQEGAESNYISSINGLAEFDGGFMSGWMGTLNDWFTNYGFDAFKVKAGNFSAGDEIHIMYTCDYGEDLGGSWGNTDNTVKAVAFKTTDKDGKPVDVGTLDREFKKDDHEQYTLTLPAGQNTVMVMPTASNKNYQVRASVDGKEYKRNDAIPVKANDVITVKCGDPTWPSMNDNSGAAQTYTFKVAYPSVGNLSELAFGSAMAAANKGNYALSPVFVSNTHEYTVTVPDSVSALYAWATLSETATGNKINCNYKTTAGADKTQALTSAKTTGQTLATIIAKGSKGNTVTVAVGDQDYTVNIVRSATLSGLSFTNSGSEVEMDKAFAATTTEYAAVVPKVAALSATVTPTSQDAVVTVNGQPLGDTVPLNWEGDNAKVEIKVSYGSDATATIYTLNVRAITGLDGSGTASDPYLIKNADDMVTLSNLVKGGATFSGMHIHLKADVTLPKGWTPIGDLTDAAKEKYIDYTTTIKVKDSTPFKGIFDGEDHTITVPAGELTAFGSVFHATLKNFKIYGEKIPGYGVVQYWLQRSSSAEKDNNQVIIENVTLKSGTHTMMSGFLGGYESGMDRIIMRNCTVEEGVVIGNDGSDFWKDYATEGELKGVYAYGPTGPLYQTDFVGSFIGAGSGEIIGCKSSAKVYGHRYVGGIWGFKGQSMGDCLVRECVFDGEVIASDIYAGGILGAGYTSTSAPNTPSATVQNCACYGKVTAADYVGGIFGGEFLLKQNWNNGTGYIQNNFFNGQIVTEGSNKGAIIGYFNVLDNTNIISNNYYVTGCGADKGMTLNGVDTSANYAPRYDIKAGDDPESFCKAVASASEAIEGLNNGVNSSKTWKLVDNKAVCGSDKHIVSIFSAALSNNPPKSISTLNDLDEEALTVTYNDGTTEQIKVKDCEKEDWDFETAKVYTPVKLNYQNVQYNILINPSKVIRDLSVRLSADKQMVVKGDTVTVDVLYYGSLSAYDFALSYDTDKLEYVDAQWGGKTGVINSADAETLDILFNATDAVPFQAEDGKLISVTFKCKDIGEMDAFGLVVNEMALNDSEFNPTILQPTIVDKIGHLNGYIPGDVNMDGKVSIVDANRIQLDLAKYITLSDAQKAAADAYVDQAMDVFDVNAIQLFLAKLVEALPVFPTE